MSTQTLVTPQSDTESKLASTLASMSVSSTQSNQSAQLSTKKGKKYLTAYWAVELSNEAFEHGSIKAYLDANPHLVKLTKIHSTLLYVGKVDSMQDKEDTIAQHVGKNCALVVDAFGCSDEACALRIKSISLCDTNETVPSFAVQQHVTLALKVGTPAKDSVLTLTKECSVPTVLPTELVLYGTVKRYMF